MNNLRKSFIFLSFILISVVLFSNCKNVSGVIQKKQGLENIEFTEVRRLNHTVNLKEYTIINSTKGIKDLYGKLNDSKFSRSSPIPILEGENECFLVLKPKLKKIKYGDIQIEKIEAKGSILIINYRETESDEYAEKKQSNPIVILKVFNRPKTIQFNQLK
ncbi:hypothetical protein EG348_14805 [Chryseobacterium sp. G0201]|nr:hypothetical protein EG348_14805 [Chryseobacterium sp. G0201]